MLCVFHSRFYSCHATKNANVYCDNCLWHQCDSQKIISLNDLDHAYSILRRNLGHVPLGGRADCQLQILVLCWTLCLRERQWWRRTTLRDQEGGSTWSHVSLKCWSSYAGTSGRWWRYPFSDNWNWSEQHRYPREAPLTSGREKMKVS
jgi:hypothetical protein